MQARIAIALQDIRVVLIVGPRRAGKTTPTRQYTTLERPRHRKVGTMFPPVAALTYYAFESCFRLSHMLL